MDLYISSKWIGNPNCKVSGVMDLYVRSKLIYKLNYNIFEAPTQLVFRGTAWLTDIIYEDDAWQ